MNQISNILPKSVKKLFSGDLLDFVKHAKNYLTGDFFTKGLVFISVPIYTRIMSQEEFGVISVFLSLHTLFHILFEFGLKGSITRYYFEEKNDFREFLGSTIISFSAINALIFLLLFAFRYFFSESFNINPNIFLYATVTGSLLSVLNFYLAYLVVTKNSRVYSIINVIKNSAILLLSIPIILILESDKYYGRIYPQIFILSIFAVIAFSSLIKISKIGFKSKYLKYSLVFGTPLIFHSVSGYVLGVFDQVIINQLVGPEQTAIYSVAFQIGMILQVIVVSSTRSWIPILFQRLNEGKVTEANLLAKNYSKIIFSFAILLILFSQEILFIFAKKEYFEVINIVPIILLGYSFFFLHQIYSNIIFYHKKTYLIAAATVVAGGIKIIINYYYIPIYGYAVAAYSSLVSFSFLAFLHYCNKRFFLKDKITIPLKNVLPRLIFVIISIFVFELILEINLNFFTSLIVRLITLVILITLLWLPMKSFKKIIKQV